MMRHCVLVVALLATLGTAKANPALQLIVSNESAPAGGTVQVKVFAVTPTPIASGRVLVSFDPSIFGSITQVAFFSAAGDAYGAPTIQGTMLDLNFQSASGGVGCLPGLPVFTVTIPILATASPGATAQITLDTSPAPWMDPNGNAFAVQSIPGAVTVSGNLWIGNVTPGGGVQPAGTAVRVAGSGFNPAATLSVSGVSVSSFEVVSPQEIDFILRAPAELTGKRVRVQNPDGSVVDYFPSFRPVPADAATQQFLSGGAMIFPLRTWVAATPGIPSDVNLALQNPSAVPIDVTVNGGSGQTYQSTVPAGGILTVVGGIPAGDYMSAISASAPIQIVTYTVPPDQYPINLGGIATLFPVQALPPPPPSSSGLPPHPRRSERGSTLAARPKAAQQTQLLATLEFALQEGSPPSTQRAYDAGALIGIFSSSTDSGGNWLSGTSPDLRYVEITVNPAGLVPGTYQGTVTITYNPAVGQEPQQIAVTLYVLNSAPALTLAPPNLIFSYAVYQGSPGTPDEIDQIMTVNSNPPGAAFEIQSSGPVEASASALVGQISRSLVTPEPLYVTPSATRPGIYDTSITVSGSGQSAVAPVKIEVTAGPTPQPVVGAVVDAASQEIGPVSPGEIVTIHGDLIGPPSSYGLRFARDGMVSTELASTVVTFDGIEAPIFFASESELNVMVPYGIPNPNFTLVRVTYFNVPSVEVGVPVVATAP